MNTYRKGFKYIVIAACVTALLGFICGEPLDDFRARESVYAMDEEEYNYILGKIGEDANYNHIWQYYQLNESEVKKYCHKMNDMTEL